MVGGLQNNDVRQDILDAKNIGLDGFALNFGTDFYECKLNAFLTKSRPIRVVFQ
jgi:hypothetical protein